MRRPAVSRHASRSVQFFNFALGLVIVQTYSYLILRYLRDTSPHNSSASELHALMLVLGYGFLPTLSVLAAAYLLSIHFSSKTESEQELD